ncbi:MAG: zinc ribbon domain-containing protein [Gemmatimonadetes bacterium]|jgi:putative FmdB family regulatory protein|nr:zinc ribbon domain-containing protein [Gemmatimonadota bacterium]MBT4612827.1 zinc ribbon domain-containing protein [Gemmatimonadota bacterium]MBT5055629.1 zinc ribbon domain-containing protein [Gemmatimonadota bacterium]MBT5143792.1 zinc ribbon domain-containing protein [Gemmatimonadota bacterium]MBT5590559.1 zinc ribbon domain-containing protein [Gemmatimonadota bacterium]
MPNYDYECPKCGHEFETYQPITDDPLTKCPQKGCRGKVQRLIGGGGGLLFKGSGFYITDYRSDNYKKAAKADSGASSSGGDSKSSGDKSSSSDSKSSTASPKSD